MITWTFLWILIPIILQHSASEFVVREIRACCHHQINFSCSSKEFRIAIVQARFVQEVDEKESIAAVISGQSSSPYIFQEDHRHHRFIPASQRSVSLWDLDVKFSNELHKDNIQRPIPINALPEWHPDHISQTALRQRFYPSSRPTIPASISVGKNFTQSRVLEMPMYEMSFLDTATVWRQPLFPVVSSESSESSSLYTSKYFVHQTRKQPENKCLSYQTLMSSGKRATSRNWFPASSRNSGNSRWHFKDLRSYFNRRCSGKLECDVNLLRNNDGQDEDITQVCHLMPDGKIIVKYICFNESNEHSKCNVDIAPATEGFLMNPGYPDLYPGDQTCQFRLHVPQQRILLILFDVALRPKDKDKCRDELTITESQQFQVLSTCGDHGSAIAFLSDSPALNITLQPKSVGLAFPKRGFLAYFRAIGCPDPRLPHNSYLSFRNSTMCKVVCDVGHVFADSLSRVRWLYCSPLDHRWLGLDAFCSDIRNLVGRNISIDRLLRNDPSVWPVRDGNHVPNYYTGEIGLPTLLLLGVFVFHGIILYLIWRQRSRLEEIENERNMEKERMCATNAAEEGSIFSFPDSLVEDLWDQQEDDTFEIEETDQEHTLTTLTLQTSTPTSSTIRRMTEFSFTDERPFHFRWCPNGWNHQNLANGRNGHGPREHIPYVHGQLLPVRFNGYFRQTAV